MKKLIDFWAVLTLAFSGLVLYWFLNIVVFGEVCYYEQNIIILIAEYLLALFVFGMSFYIAWNILFRDKSLDWKVEKRRINKLK